MLNVNFGKSLFAVSDKEFLDAVRQKLVVTESPVEINLQFSEGTLSLRRADGRLEYTGSTFRFDQSRLDRITGLFSNNPSALVQTNEVTSFSSSFTLGGLHATRNKVEVHPRERAQGLFMGIAEGERHAAANHFVEAVKIVTQPSAPWHKPGSMRLTGEAIDMCFIPANHRDAKEGTLSRTTHSRQEILDVVKEAFQFSSFQTLEVEYFSETNERSFVVVRLCEITEHNLREDEIRQILAVLSQY